MITIPFSSQYFSILYDHPVVYLHATNHDMRIPDMEPVACFLSDTLFISDEMSKPLVKAITTFFKVNPPKVIAANPFLDMKKYNISFDEAMAKYVANNILGA